MSTNGCSKHIHLVTSKRRWGLIKEYYLRCWFCNFCDGPYKHEQDAWWAVSP